MTVWQSGQKVLELEQLDREQPPGAAGGLTAPCRGTRLDP
jgi:hypothetical protein